MKTFTTTLLLIAGLTTFSNAARAQDLTDAVILTLKASTVECQDKASGETATISFKNCQTGDNRSCDVVLEADDDSETLMTINSSDFQSFDTGSLFVSYGDSPDGDLLQTLAPNEGVFFIEGDGTGFYLRYESDTAWTAIFPTNKRIELTGCHWGNS